MSVNSLPEPSSASKLLGKLPLLLLVAGVLTLGYLIFRQMGYDSRDVEVVDLETQKATTYRIVSVLPRDAISAISDPKFVPTSTAASWMDDREQVIGLELGGQVKAYPINMLSRHEIVNDVVGGTPLAITW